MLVLAGTALADPKAKPVVSVHAKADRIAVTKGELADGGAGVGRWAARTIDGCFEDQTGLRNGTASAVVTMTERGSTLALTGAAELRRCLEGRLSQLVWTKPDQDPVVVGMRLVVTERANPPDKRTEHFR